MRGRGQRLYCLIFYMFVWFEGLSPKYSTTHPWRDGNSINISACEVWVARAEVQVFKRKFHTHIHLDLTSTILEGQ